MTKTDELIAADSDNPEAKVQRFGKSAIEKWKDFLMEQRFEKKGVVDDDVVSFPSSTKHFSYTKERKDRRKKNVGKVKVQHEQVFHQIKWHEMEEINVQGIRGKRPGEAYM